MGIHYNTNIVRDGLVLYFDAANIKSYPRSGTTIYDLSGNGSNGTLTNGPTFDNNNNGSIVFDGINDRIDSGSYFPSVISGTNNFTIDCIVYPNNSQPTYADIWGNHTEPYSGIVMQQNAGNTNQYSWSFGCGTYWGVSSGLFNLTSLVWSYVSAVKNGSTLSVYVNGNFVTSGTENGSIVPNSSFNFQFGAGYNLDSGRYFNGKISMGKIYNRALSTTEITQNFNAVRGRYGI